jgi:hypothetical protein
MLLFSSINTYKSRPKPGMLTSFQKNTPEKKPVLMKYADYTHR